MNHLAKLNLLLFATLIAHLADHALNQPVREGPASGVAIGIGGVVVVAASALLAMRRSPLAPAAAVFAGASTALGTLAIHLAPGWWGFVSDPYWDFGANAITGRWPWRRSSSEPGSPSPAPARRRRSPPPPERP